MKRIKINWFKFTRFIIIFIITLCFIYLFIDFCKYTECYLPTWKYQLKNDIYQGDNQSIQFYEDVYVSNNRDLFNDKFKIRNTYVEQNVKDSGNNIVEKDNASKDTVIISDEISQSANLKSLGIFVSTGYCIENYSHICNNGDATKTATGTTPTHGRTIAVDPKVIPLGSKVEINGHTYIAEDTGGAIKGNRIDMVFATHKEALEYGKRNIEVFIYE